MKTILVTGGAGFIGFHVSEKLLKRGDRVIIVDNFNDYYDPQLKKDRARILKEKYDNLKIYKIDIGDYPTLEKIFKSFRIDKVCNLAAQAGVRYTLKNPFTYQHANNLGFLNILELCRHYGVKDLVFASSSSVYGGNKEYPFRENDRVDAPLSLYAATKKSNEETAYVYHHNFDINCIGLRFFTVYGPWGRPDMGVFQFVDKIAKGEPIDVYNYGDVGRDFTYIDDIVSGVISAIDKSYTYEIINLARGEAVNLTDYINEIEKNLGVTAKKNMMPLPRTDVPYTSADITKAKELLGYDPRIPVQEGIKRKIEWYKDYYGIKPQENFKKNHNINKENKIVNKMHYLKPKKILVTGGAGFIGSNLCKKLLEYGNEVVCVDNFITGRKENVQELMKNSRFELLRHDITHPLYIEVDQIYNLACPASPPQYQYNAIKTIKCSTVGMLNMLGLAKRVKARFLQASTSEVYGNPEMHPQKEEYWGNVNPIGLRSCYDEGKRVAECLCMDYHRQNGVDIRIVRIFNTYGPNMDPDDGRVVSNFIVKALQNKSLEIYGDGSQTRSFQYIDDLLEGMVAMMEQDGFLGPVNLGNPHEFTIKELAEIVLKLIPQSESQVVYKELPSDDPLKRRPDIDLAKKKLNWEPKIQLHEGLPKTVEYFKKVLI